MNRLGIYLMFCLAALLAGCASNQPAPVIERAAPTTLEGAGAQAASTPAGFYIVKKGDTLYSIALDHGCSYRDIAAWNSLSDPNKIEVGQQLRVAPPEAAAAPSEAAGGAEVRPVAAPAPVEAQPLTAPGAPVAAPAPVSGTANTDTLKLGPIGGEQPYSEAALARLQKTDSTQTPAPVPPPVVPAAAPVPAPASQAANDDGVDWGWPMKGKVIAGFVEGANKGIDIAAKPGDPVLAAAAGKVVYAGTGLRGYGKLVIVKHNALFLSAYAHNSQILVKEGQSVAKGQEIAEAGSTDSDQPMLHFEIRRQGKPVDPLKHLPSR
ncbi:murein hydrolase activator NlpD precursor [mine drainage metagenome]|uniref:Murein hydrolase activator NlpD n=1 Tax=mine drainage metagenome TaxID=410659 RepID=A0A1J5R3K5_9ZZZZ